MAAKTPAAKPTIQVPFNWAPRLYQRNLWGALESGVTRAVAVWHRRAGKDVVSMNWAIREAVRRPGLYWHILPTYNQGRKIVWNGMTRDGRRFLDFFPPELIQRTLDQEMTIWLESGSMWQVVGTDDVDRLVGANPIGCVFSEYSLQNPKAWNYLRPILLENGGWALFIYTPRGRNHGHKLLETARTMMARGDPRWFAEVLTVEDTGVVTEEQIENERLEGMPESMVQQEYFASFDAPLVGAYYTEQLNRARREGRITSVPWESRIPVFTCWDLGVRDALSIWFGQQVRNEVRWIDYYHSSGVGLDHYAKILKEKPYAYGEHFVPHDAEVRELGSQAKSRVETARELGLHMSVQPRHDLADGIDATRHLLNRSWFDEKKCDRGLESLKQYVKEQTDEEGPDGEIIYRDKPKHNWASHGADALRTGAMALVDNPWETSFRQPDASWVV